MLFVFRSWISPSAICVICATITCLIIPLKTSLDEFIRFNSSISANRVKQNQNLSIFGPEGPSIFTQIFVRFLAFWAIQNISSVKLQVELPTNEIKCVTLHK